MPFASLARKSGHRSHILAVCADCDRTAQAWRCDSRQTPKKRVVAFAGLTLEGASIRQDNDSRKAISGRKITTRALLLGKVPAPPAAQPFLGEIRGAKAQAVAEGKAEAKSEAKEKDK